MGTRMTSFTYMGRHFWFSKKLLVETNGQYAYKTGLDDGLELYFVNQTEARAWARSFPE